MWTLRGYEFTLLKVREGDDWVYELYLHISITKFLPEQLVTINEEQIIQTAGMIVSTGAIKKVDAMLVRQLQIGEYDG